MNALEQARLYMSNAEKDETDETEQEVLIILGGHYAQVASAEAATRSAAALERIADALEILATDPPNQAINVYTPGKVNHELFP